MKLNLKFFFFLAFSVFCCGFVWAQSLDYFGNQNFARAQNYNEIAVAKNWDVFVAYDDNTCSRRGLSVKKKSFESEVWEQVGNVCLTENTTSLISLAVDPKTWNPWVIAKDSMANTKIKLFAFDGNQWQSISTDWLIQSVNVGFMNLHFNKNWDIFVSQSINWISYIKEYKNWVWSEIWNFSSSLVNIDSDDNGDLVVLVWYGTNIKVLRYDSGEWIQLWSDVVNLEQVSLYADIKTQWTDIYVVYANDMRKLTVLKYDWMVWSRLWNYASDAIRWAKPQGVWLAITDNKNVFISYTDWDTTALNFVKYDGVRTKIYHATSFAPIHSDLASIQNAVLMAYWDDTASQYWSYTNVMKYWDFVVEDNLPDLTIEDLDLAYWYGATYSDYPYYSGADWVSYVQKDEKVLVFDAKIKNISSVESNRTFATCQAYSIYNILTYPLYWPTPIIGSFDSVNQLIRFNEFEWSMLTSTLWTKNLSCMVDQDELIEEWNENNNTFDFSFEVVNNTCEFYADACEAGSMDCPWQCVYAQFYDDYEWIKPKYINIWQTDILVHDFYVRSYWGDLFAETLYIKKNWISWDYISDFKLYDEDWNLVDVCTRQDDIYLVCENVDLWSANQVKKFSLTVNTVHDLDFNIGSLSPRVSGAKIFRKSDDYIVGFRWLPISSIDWVTFFDNLCEWSIPYDACLIDPSLCSVSCELWSTLHVSLSETSPVPSSWETVPGGSSDFYAGSFDYCAEDGDIVLQQVWLERILGSDETLTHVALRHNGVVISHYKNENSYGSVYLDIGGWLSIDDGTCETIDILVNVNVAYDQYWNDVSAGDSFRFKVINILSDADEVNIADHMSAVWTVSENSSVDFKLDGMASFDDWSVKFNVRNIWDVLYSWPLSFSFENIDKWTVNNTSENVNLLVGDSLEWWYFDRNLTSFDESNIYRIKWFVNPNNIPQESNTWNNVLQKNMCVDYWESYNTRFVEAHDFACENWLTTLGCWFGPFILQLEAWGNFSCVLMSDWNVECRWSNYYWQSLGYSWWNAIQVSAWSNHACVLKSDWNVECWGRNSESYNWWDVVKVRSWGDETCLLKEDWTIYCLVNEQLLYTWSDFVDFWLNSNSFCILKNDWNVDCFWYSNGFSILDDYNWWDAIQLSLWDYMACVLIEGGNVECWWDRNDYWELDWYSWWDAIGVWAWRNHWCVLKNDWNVECWGRDLWLGSYSWWDATSLSVWSFHGCVLNENWNVECWWSNSVWQSVNYESQSFNDTSSAQVCGYSNRGHFATQLKRIIDTMWIDVSDTYDNEAMCNFGDLPIGSFYYDDVIFVCKAGLMWCSDWTYNDWCLFQPGEVLTREKFASAFSRLLRWNTYGGLFDYGQHIDALDNNGVIDLTYFPQDVVHRVEIWDAIKKSSDAWLLSTNNPIIPVSLTARDFKFQTDEVFAGKDYKASLYIENNSDVNISLSDINFVADSWTKIKLIGGTCSWLKSLSAGSKCSYDFLVYHNNWWIKKIIFTVNSNDQNVEILVFEKKYSVSAVSIKKPTLDTSINLQKVNTEVKTNEKKLDLEAFEKVMWIEPVKKSDKESISKDANMENFSKLLKNYKLD